jgi:hypothetical protein
MALAIAIGSGNPLMGLVFTVIALLILVLR